MLGVFVYVSVQSFALSKGGEKTECGVIVNLNLSHRSLQTPPLVFPIPDAQSVVWVLNHTFRELRLAHPRAWSKGTAKQMFCSVLLKEHTLLRVFIETREPWSWG